MQQRLIGCLPSTQIHSSARTLFLSELVQHAPVSLPGVLSDSSSLVHDKCFATKTMILATPLCVLIAGNAIGLSCAAEDTIRFAEFLGWSTHADDLEGSIATMMFSWMFPLTSVGRCSKCRRPCVIFALCCPPERRCPCATDHFCSGCLLRCNHSIT